jgi:hypothetical protein
MAMNWDVSKVVPNNTNPARGQGAINLSSNYTYGTTSGQFANAFVRGLLTIAGAATNNYPISANSLPNPVGTVGTTLTFIKEMLIELLGADQTDDLQNPGTTAASVLVGGATGQAWNGPMGIAGTWKINNGDKLHLISSDAGGWPVVAGDLLKLLNNDAANPAHVRMTLIGLG